MRNLELNVEIYKVGLLRDYQVAKEKVEIPGLIYANKVIKNETTYRKCLSQKTTKYYGIAFASAVIDGQLRKTSKSLLPKLSLLNVEPEINLIYDPR
jgi:hypothetical protein